MSKPKPLSEPSPKPAIELEAADPLGLGVAKRSKRLRGGPIVAVAAAFAVVILAFGSIVWLWHVKGRSALAPSVGAVQLDPDPPFAAPPVKDLIKPASNDKAAPITLDKNLEALAQAAADVPDAESSQVTNERIRRWEIRFPSGNTQEGYARQLDALGIELGVIGGGERIAYASAFTKDPPARRDGPAADEQRFYMTWRSGALRDLDNALLSRAKIQTSERIVAQFYPPQLETALADLEKQFAAPRDLAEVRHTVFALMAADKSYEFRVAEQEYVTGEVKNADAKPAAAKNEKPPPANGKAPR